MFARFNYLPENYYYNHYFNPHLESGRKIYNATIEKTRKCLRGFILENGHIDGTALKDHWFNIIDADVFISHSHKDIEKVKGFAGWLYDQFGLTSFIDSCVWGYCDDLLKDMDNMYCWQSESKTYSYELRNYTTTHVHTMLSSALTEMIDRSECVIFYNTPNSIMLTDELNNVKKGNTANTLSPWIYHELSVSSMIRTQKPKRMFIEHRDEGHFQKNELKVEYDVSKFLDEMIMLTDDMIVKWDAMCESHNNPLDELYKIVCRE